MSSSPGNVGSGGRGRARLVAGAAAGSIPGLEPDRLLAAARERLTGLSYGAEEARTRARRAGEGLLDHSRHVRTPNFAAIHVEDLSRLFALYDALFFGSSLRGVFAADPSRSLDFRLSTRMTNAAGKTFFQRRRSRGGGAGRREYQIAISSYLLFQTFRDPASTAAAGGGIAVCGLPCAHRLEALQRVFEHELVHLVEFLFWEESSCARPRFKELAGRLFGHRESHHELLTPEARARRVLDLKVGDRVRFEHEGREHAGMLNRITKRATVLVPDPNGRPYSDGGRYRVFYVPLEALRRDDERTGTGCR